MKKILSVMIVLMAMTVGAFAQDATPRADQRQHQQVQRIRHGLANGDLTRREAYRLLKQQHHIRRREYIAKADGCVTQRERAQLHRAQGRANRQIFMQRHDRVGRMN